jgi:F-type H+-transporting ATPase subunit a
MIFTPLEQFQIISLIPLNFFFFDFSLTNLLLISLFTLLLFFFLVIFSSKNNSFFFIPHIWQYFLEIINETVTTLLYDNINKEGEKYFPFIAVIFTFIILVNLIGLAPYSFTVTSHLIITLTMSFSIFIGINIICIKIHGKNILSLFLPSNTSFGLALLLIPIEFVSYIFKPISLGVRLFANLMAGHTLLKVIIGFSWSMLLLENFLSIFHIIPVLVVVLLFGLELGVALIQAYVFTILTCIYLNDSVNLH